MPTFQKNNTSVLQKIALVGFGIVSFFVFLEIALRIAGASFLYMQEKRNARAIAQAGVCRVMCIGESTTALGDKFSFPAQLEEILNTHSAGIKFSVINKGAVGMDTSYIISQLEGNLNTYRPDIAVVMMGINDTLNNKIFEVSWYGSIFEWLRSARVYKLAELAYRHAAARLAEISQRRAALKAQAGFLQKEVQAQQALALDPRSVDNIIRLGWLYVENKDFESAHKIFKKAAILSPDSIFVYLGAGWFYKQKARFIEARKAFQAALALNPRSDKRQIVLADMTSIELARLFKEEGNLSESAKILQSIVASGTLRYVAYIELGWIYQTRGEYALAEDAFEKALQLNQNAIEAYLNLGWIYWYQDKYTRAEGAFIRAIKQDPEEPRSYIGLATVYRFQNKQGKALDLLKELIKRNPYYDKLHGSLEGMYEAAPLQFQGAKEYLQEVKAMENTCFNLTTVLNYNTLHEMLRRRGIRFICVQYPMRSLSPLKSIFKDRQGIRFVDNQKSFKDAVKKDGYKAYFTDMFGGDFGHCTPKGNRLLAENIAEVILAELNK